MPLSVRSMLVVSTTKTGREPIVRESNSKDAKIVISFVKKGGNYYVDRKNGTEGYNSLSCKLN